MYKLIEKSDHCHGDVFDVVALPYELRQRGRFKATSNAGHEVGIFLPRGDVLRQGDYLFSECGKTFLVEAKAELLSVAQGSNWFDFARACYHLGNRHVPLQIGEMELAFQPDHVLEEMVTLFGLSVQQKEQGFNPESGAYAGGHKHGHSHEHDHSHGYDHSHADPEHSH